MIEFLDRDRVRVGFLGVCRSGKSYACWEVVEELLAQPPYGWALIHDTIRDPQYPPEAIERKYPGRYPRELVTSSAEALAALRRGATRIVARHPMLAGDLAELALELRRAAPATWGIVVFDELDVESINNDGKWADQRVHDLYHHGRGLSILGCTQRPKGMPKGARGLHDAWFCFRLTGEELADLKGFAVPSWAQERIPQLPRGAFIVL